MSRCTYIMKTGSRFAGEQCSKEEGHRGSHESESARKNRLAYQSTLERRIAKRRWDRDNAWPNTCVDCGAACGRRSTRCNECNRPLLARNMRERAKTA